MNEKQLQAKFVMGFSQKYPERHGLLFALNNEAANNKHAMTLEAIGVFKGASDLIYFDGNMTCMEVKLPGAEHKRDHIMNQLDWGTRIALAGGNYYIVTNIDSFFSVIDGQPDSRVYTLDKIREVLETQKSKIVFQ